MVAYYTCSRNTAGLADEACRTIEKQGWQVECVALRDAADGMPPFEPDFIVLGTPVQYFTIPEDALRMIKRLPDFHGTPAFVFSSFGGCVSNNVPYLLATELSKKGATIVGGAQFLTPHSCRINGGQSLGHADPAFGKGHPDKNELDAFRRALTRLVDSIERGNIAAVDPNLLKINTMGAASSVMELFSTLKLKRLFMPHVDIQPDACTGCKKCSAVCDAGSLAYTNGGTVSIDRKTCTKCYACIEACPDGALTTNWKQAELLVRAMNAIARPTPTTIIP